MSDPVPVTGPAFLGNATAGLGVAESLSNAETLTLLGIAIDAEAPSTAPDTVRSLWVDSSGYLRITSSDPPTGTVAISETSVSEGVSVTITYTQSGGISATAFQLRKDGTNVGSSQGTGVFVLSSPVEADSGVYDVVATNGGGSQVSSNTVTLTVRALDPYYTVSGFSDSIYFESVANVGLRSLGTVRLVFRLLSVPTSSLRFICGTIDSGGTVGGWYFRTGVSGAGAINCAVVTSAGFAASPSFTLQTGDINRIFVAHATIRGGKVRLYIGGTEVGTGTAVGTPTNPTSADKLCVGKWQHATGISSSNISIVSFATSTASLTDQEIADDAAQIQDDAEFFDAPTLPSQTERWDAVDIGAAWVSRGPGTLSLAKTGSPTITGPL